MENLFHCEICLEKYVPETRKPMVFPCGHSFCSNCIGTQVNMKRCAVCKKPIHFNNKDEVPIN